MHRKISYLLLLALAAIVIYSCNTENSYLENINKERDLIKRFVAKVVNSNDKDFVFEDGFYLKILKDETPIADDAPKPKSGSKVALYMYSYPITNSLIDTCEIVKGTDGYIKELKKPDGIIRYEPSVSSLSNNIQAMVMSLMKMKKGQRAIMIVPSNLTSYSVYQPSNYPQFQPYYFEVELFDVIEGSVTD